MRKYFDMNYSNLNNNGVKLISIDKNINEYCHYIISKPARSHIETEVVCTIPHKLTLLASGPLDSTAKHPKKGVS